MIPLFKTRKYVMVPTYGITNWHSSKMGFLQKDTQLDTYLTQISHTHTAESEIQR